MHLSLSILQEEKSPLADNLNRQITNIYMHYILTHITGNFIRQANTLGNINEQTGIYLSLLFEETEN